MLAIRELPGPQRAAWHAWFEHFVFGDEARQVAGHLPPHGQGVAGPATPERNEAIRRFLLTALGSR